MTAQFQMTAAAVSAPNPPEMSDTLHYHLVRHRSGRIFTQLTASAVFDKG